ncbi:MAG: hypothetical protein GYA63_07510 [Armatimonadetes bacterium]|nr:hypothetical protein [Armatimonadota bacterium]
MKRFITGILAVGLALTAFTGSQNATAGPPTKTKAPAASSSNPLGLSATQRKKLEAINAKAMKEMMAIRNAGGTQQVQTGKMTALQQKTMAEINAVLTPAQRTKFQQLQAQAMQKVMAEQAADQQLRSRMTPAQIQQLTKVQKSAQAEAMKVVNNNNLTQEQKDAKLKAIEKNYLAQKAKITKSVKK